MKVSELQEDARDIDFGPDDGIDPESRKFYKILIGVFLAIIVIFMIIPYYGVPFNPAPKQVAKITPYWELPSVHFSSIYDAYDYDVSPVIRQSAITITSSACKGGEVCYARSLFYYVRDNVNYLSDPSYEYIQTPEETLLGAGDCEDKAILLAYLMKATGISSRLVLIPDHAYLEIYMPDAPGRYKGRDGWIPLDATCTGCEFGEIPPGTPASTAKIPI